jgi:hypothetical protein
MNRRIVFLLCFFAFQKVYSQEFLQGLVKDAGTGEPLSNATISFYNNGRSFGMITNQKGQFVINQKTPDSIRISMIGYQSKLLLPPFESNNQTVLLLRAIISMETIVVQPIPAEQIVQKAIKVLDKNRSVVDFESLAFYREIIKDRENYFSVSEALFKTQYFPREKNFTLELEQGRTKEDVAYTRLFEDYHPGGGPQLMAKQGFADEIPDCLQASKMKYFIYKKDSLTYLDNHRIYVISFDQKDGVKEAFEKGKVFIDAEDFSVLSYTGSNSPKSTAYIKSLTGNDKLMAKILNIDFEVLGWSRKLYFNRSGNNMFLSFASFEQQAIYKQPKKDIDLNLKMSFEWMVSETGLPVIKKIGENEEWKRNNLMVNLPTAFDSSFWGGKAIISPTDSLTAILASISSKNKDEQSGKPIEGWKILNRKFFVASKNDSKISITPIMKSVWENDVTGPFVFKDTSGNFSIECKLQVVKTSNSNQEPDKGFQQGGLMIRADSVATENYIFIALGTGGNPNPKLFFKKTENNKSRSIVTKAKKMMAFLRIEKRETTLKAYIRWNENDEWEILNEYKSAWLKDNVQIGMAAFTDFTGNGPKMHPDASFIFSDVQFKN